MDSVFRIGFDLDVGRSSSMSRDQMSWFRGVVFLPLGSTDPALVNVFFLPPIKFRIDHRITVDELLCRRVE